MNRFWTTAAMAALCAFGTGAWAAPQTQYLELVASKTLRGAEAGDSATTARRHSRHKHETRHTSSKSRRRHHAEEEHAHGRRSRRHAAEHAASKTSTHSRRGRHHAEQAASQEHGRHGARREAVRSEIHTEAGASVKVGRHDTLESIARRHGVSVAELARLNHLRRPYHLRRGERLKLPEQRYYVVKDGDTLYSLGRRFGVEPSELAKANGIRTSRHLRVGQKLSLPSAAAEAAAPPEQEARPERETRRPERREPAYTEPFEGPGAARTPSAPAAPTRPLTIPPGSSPYQAVPPAQPPSAQQPPFGQGPEQATPRSAPSQATPAPTPTPIPGAARPLIPSNPTPSTADITAAGRGKFVWPVQGQIISPFGHKPDGTSNDGVNISANAGDPVRAAADGQVVYAGDQVPSFGNLVLIKHAGGWVTAYAHMARILVKNRDEVVQGQQIGVVGQTGSVTRPQLHFEIRYAPSPKDKAAPVDPTLILPQQ